MNKLVRRNVLSKVNSKGEDLVENLLICIEFRIKCRRDHDSTSSSRKSLSPSRALEIKKETIESNHKPDSYGQIPFYDPLRGSSKKVIWPNLKSMYKGYHFNNSVNVDSLIVPRVPSLEKLGNHADKNLVGLAYRKRSQVAQDNNSINSRNNMKKSRKWISTIKKPKFEQDQLVKEIRGRRELLNKSAVNDLVNTQKMTKIPGSTRRTPAVGKTSLKDLKMFPSIKRAQSKLPYQQNDVVPDSSFQVQSKHSLNL